MTLHNFPDAFDDLTALAAHYKGIPVSAAKRDYFIVFMLQKLSKNVYNDRCVFKGGTSLSKGYPNSIMRFSEDIDLSFIPDPDSENDNQIENHLKRIEKIMSEGLTLEKIAEERNKRNKSARVWYGDLKDLSVKLEIGSSVRPDPYEPRSICTYIQEYLESKGLLDEVKEFELQRITINTLCIERTFIDKVMSVKRHAICGSLERKVRHIYDVAKLFELKEIKDFLDDKSALKDIVQKTKRTDSFYLEKRNVSKECNPLQPYNLSAWIQCFNDDIRAKYETLHNDLLYTDEKQDFDKAIEVFRSIDNILSDIGE